MKFFAIIPALAVVLGASAQSSTHHAHHTTVAAHHTGVSHAHTAVTHAHTHGNTHAHAGTTPSPQDHHLGKQVVELLVMRGEQIIENAEKEIATLEKNGHGHLVHALKNEVALAEQLITGIRHELAQDKHHDIHKIHEIEEMLLHVENRLSEEVRAIEYIKTHPQEHITVDQLIKNGEKLEKEAKAVLEKFGDSHHRIANAIHNELHALKELIDELHKKPAHEDAVKEAMRLARHEVSMQQLLKQAEHELKHGNHGNHGHNHGN